ncbi:MAG TPA: energy transducer TonB [Candidatus Acidoferrales bacterium]|nr:energy transducer TonB [Candidatus Acidoferrales bacterium]
MKFNILPREKSRLGVMRRAGCAASMALMLFSPALGAHGKTRGAAPTCAMQDSGAHDDRPAEVAEAGDAYSNYEVIFDGFFVLRVELASDGSIVRIRTLRDPGGSMIPRATSAIQSWKFKPAVQNGAAQPSEITVAFVYPPRVIGTPALGKFDPVIPEPRRNPPPRHNSGHRDPKHPGYAPAGILAVAYANNINTVTTGSVVVQISLDDAGQVTGTQVLYGKDPFTAQALEAFKKWQFQAATLDGKPVPSDVVVAYIFPMPVVNTQ